MYAVRLARVTAIEVGISAAIVIAAPVAFAQTSVKAVFEKHNLLAA